MNPVKRRFPQTGHERQNLDGSLTAQRHQDDVSLTPDRVWNALGHSSIQRGGGLIVPAPSWCPDCRNVIRDAVKEQVVLDVVYALGTMALFVLIGAIGRVVDKL